MAALPMFEVRGVFFEKSGLPLVAGCFSTTTPNTSLFSLPDQSSLHYTFAFLCSYLVVESLRVLGISVQGLAVPLFSKVAHDFLCFLGS
jgi:hypothetical protein